MPRKQDHWTPGVRVRQLRHRIETGRADNRELADALDEWARYHLDEADRLPKDDGKARRREGLLQLRASECFREASSLRGVL